MRDRTLIVNHFDDAEHAFFAMVDRQRLAGARGGVEQYRPGSGVDTQIIIERLYRERKLSMDHILVLRHYGVRGIAPDPRREKEAKAAALWNEVMDLLKTELKQKGMIL